MKATRRMRKKWYEASLSQEQRALHNEKWWDRTRRDTWHGNGVHVSDPNSNNAYLARRQRYNSTKAKSIRRRKHGWR